MIQLDLQERELLDKRRAEANRMLSLMLDKVNPEIVDKISDYHILQENCLENYWIAVVRLQSEIARLTGIIKIQQENHKIVADMFAQESEKNMQLMTWIIRNRNGK